jgi:hypothetical protein
MVGWVQLLEFAVNKDSLCSNLHIAVHMKKKMYRDHSSFRINVEQHGKDTNRNIKRTRPLSAQHKGYRLKNSCAKRLQYRANAKTEELKQNQSAFPPRLFRFYIFRSYATITIRKKLLHDHMLHKNWLLLCYQMGRSIRIQD